jgi:hypothetical protein
MIGEKERGLTCALSPGPDEILLKLNATGVCYSDLHYCLEDLPMPRMIDFGIRSPGHEGAGVVVKIGSNVKNWKVGDRGGVKPMVSILLSRPFVSLALAPSIEAQISNRRLTSGMIVGYLHELRMVLGRHSRNALRECNFHRSYEERNISAVHYLTCKIHNSYSRQC